MLREPSVPAVTQDLTRRVYDLERQVRESVNNRRDHPPLRFVQSGTVATTTSPPATFPTGANVTAVVLLLGTAGTSDTSVVVKRNGVTLVGGTLSSGETIKTFVAGYGFTPTDKVTVAVTSAGTGAKDLDAELIYR